MISKETFLKTMEYLKKKEEADCKMQSLLQEYKDVYTDGLVPMDQASSIIVQLIEEDMELPIDDNIGSTLSWWIWDRGFGSEFKIGNLTMDSLPEGHPYRTPDLSTAEKLYDFLVWESEEAKKEKE